MNYRLKTPSRFIKALFVLMGAFALFAGNNMLRAQGDRGTGIPDPPVDLCPPGCSAGGTLNISTGFNPVTNMYQSPLAIEHNWTLISWPTSVSFPPNPPCYDINPHPAWSNFSNAKWVSPFNTYSYTVNNCGDTGPPPGLIEAPADETKGLPPPPPAGSANDPFVFQKCFCICHETTVNINFQLLCDDIAVVKLDGVTIGTSVSIGGYMWSNRLIVNTPVGLTEGVHCLTVELRNCYGVAMGFALEGSISGGSIMNTSCCSAYGSICGTKYRDVNCDGRIDLSTDVPLPGWTIVLKDNLGNVMATATTNADGNYCFKGLPAGTYIVSEQNQPGWTQTYPPYPGTYTISLAAGASVTANFANCQDLPPSDICGTKYWDHNCDGIIDPTDTPMAGWTIVLKDGFGTTIATAVTDANGNYCFKKLPGGTYVLSEVNQPGWTQTYPASPGTHTINASGAGYVADFANCEGGTTPCNVFADWNMQIMDCQASFNAILPSLPPGYSLVGTHWTFGDGESSDELNPTHYYNALGTYQVCLTTTIFNGTECCTRTFCQYITITKLCHDDCHFDANVDVQFDADQCEYTFDANVSFAGMPITNVYWDFGDGTFGSGTPIHHQFPNAGGYTVCMYLFSTVDGTCCFQKFCIDVNVNCDPCDGTGSLKNIPLSDKNIVVLKQNVPNPFAESTTISYSIPANFGKAQIIFTNADGKVIKTVDIYKKGDGQLNVYSDDLSSGTYVYTLVIDGKTMDSKRMVKN